MHPSRCLMITLLSGTLLTTLTTGCAEKRQSTRYLTESWPTTTPQAQATTQQSGETTVQGQEAAQRMDDTDWQQKP